MLKTLVVDDEYLVRAGICQTIDWSERGVEIVGQADNGEDGLELALLHRPDVIITDIRMPYMNGLELIAKVKEHKLDSGIIVLSGYDEFQYAQTAMQYGASTYLLKPVDIEQLAEAVLKVGREARERQSASDKLDLLSRELGTIAGRFWLDLLLGELPDDEALREKLTLLRLDPSDLFPLAAVVVSAAKPDESATPELATALPQQIAHHLEAHSINALACQRTSPRQWTAVVSLGEDTDSAFSRIRSFGEELTRDVGETAVGIGTPATRWEELRVSYESASSAADRAFSGHAQVLMAGERAEDGFRREIRAALAYIRTHYADNVTVEKVAAEVYVSPTHLMHLFRKELDKTFSECLTEYRIEMAKRMLRDPKYRVYEVGDLVGFGDSKYFSQVFKKMTGMPPSEYAKSQ